VAAIFFTCGEKKAGRRRKVAALWNTDQTPQFQNPYVTLSIASKCLKYKEMMCERVLRLLADSHRRKGGRHSPIVGGVDEQRPGFFNRVSEFLFLQQDGRVYSVVFSPQQ
jgi:hypothetical protein